MAADLATIVKVLNMTIVGALLVLAFSSEEVAGAPPSNNDASRCNYIMDYLSPCNPYIASSNPTSQPSSQCCSALQAVDVSCMCSFVTGPSIPNVDKSRALGLPQACNLPIGDLAQINNIAECTSG
ncbi:hypothetical protein GOP47_0011497 [Adiantum capillus-veneris]|uniref:Bifunctional inhibitor/plant lipid transfer protein/seed storage helical domain-containing protein n=1 Tax=Adiantum capillus-veneris TaxID=13818 RepID=A0A9D4UTB6_ADICA|nr:hypothetical protein GOP47_0011497 [Adiantum capillus-veneris]